MNKTMPPGMAPDTLVDLHETAADWFTRRQEPTWTGADERALNVWLEADPFHREVFDSMGRTRQLFGQLKQFRAEAAGAAQSAHSPRPHTTPLAPVASPRRGFWGAIARTPAFTPVIAVICAVLVGGGWYAWDNTPRYRLDVATAPGETRLVDLPDGSRISLNFASTLQVRYYPRRREAVLDRGEAFFQVAADAAKPFTVDSGRSQVKVVGTAFNVRAAPPRLIVKVLEGKVEVRTDRTAPGAQMLVLGANTGIAIDPATGRHVPVSAQADTVGDWRSGQLRFRHTPLEEVASEISRYLGKPVVLASSDLAQLPVSAFFTTGAPDAFIQLLPDLVAVRVQRQPDGSWLVFKR